MGRTWDLLPIHVILCGCLILAAISGFTTAFANLCFIPTGSSDYYQVYFSFEAWCLIVYLITDIFQLMNYLHGDGKELASKRCKMLNQFLDEHSARLCHICRCIGPENSKHCYLCQRCCHSWDHHWYIFNVLFGYRQFNMLSFLTFPAYFCTLVSAEETLACLLRLRCYSVSVVVSACWSLATRSRFSTANLSMSHLVFGTSCTRHFSSLMDGICLCASSFPLPASPWPLPHWSNGAVNCVVNVAAIASQCLCPGTSSFKCRLFYSNTAFSNITHFWIIFTFHLPFCLLCLIF